MDPIITFETALIESTTQLRTTVEKVQAILPKLFELKGREIDDIYNMFFVLDKKNSRSFEVNKIENTSSYYFGTLAGLIFACEAILSVLLSKKKKIDSLFSGSKKDVNRKKRILGYIQKTPGIGHKNLAECLDIDKSTLTGVIAPLVSANLVDAVVQGKFKYYYLSQSGKAFCEENRLSSELDSSLETVMDILRNMMINSKVVENYIYAEKARSVSEKKQAQGSDDVLTVSKMIRNSNIVVSARINGSIQDGNLFADLPSKAYENGRLVVDIPDKQTDYLNNNYLSRPSTAS